MRKSCLLLFTFVIACYYSMAGTIEEGTYFSSQAGTKSVNISDVTEKEFKIFIQYKTRFDEEKLSMVPAESVSRKFSLIREGLYGTDYGVKDGDGFYLQLKEDLIVITNVKYEKIIEVFYLSKKEDKERLKALAKETKTLKGKYFSQGITSPIQEKYLNQIVFSKNINAVDLQNEVEAEFVKEWNLVDPLFLRVYMDKTPGNSYLEEFNADYNDLQYGYDLYFNGQKINESIYTPSWTYHSPKLIKTWTTFKECLVCDDEAYQLMVFDGLKEAVLENMSKVVVGNHTLQLAFFVKHKDLGKKVLAKGELKLALTQTSLNKLTTNKVYWEIPEVKFVNKTYEQDILKLMNDIAKKKGWSEKFTKVSLVSDFVIINNDLTGAITGRYLEAACYATWPDGHCTYQLFDFQQQYSGNGNYSPTFYYYSTGNQRDVPCNFTK